MKNDILLFGFILIIVGIFFTFITFGIGIICTWPLIFIGIIFLILGAILPNRIKGDKFYYMGDFHNYRYCPSCGREIHFDANFCPYCGREF